MDKRKTLDSIPEQYEIDEEMQSYKWVPKKKHEVLKAKYKCLKKLFQLYDANVLGLIPDSEINCDENIRKHTKKRRQRSHRTKTDAGAGTTELSNGDLTQIIHEKQSIIMTTINRSVTTSQVEVNPSEWEADCKSDTDYLITNDGSITEASVRVLTPQPKSDKYVETTTANVTAECQCQNIIENKIPHPYYMMNRRPKPTRFQCFLQRILGIRRSNVPSGGNMYSASEGFANRDRRRRRGIRFRRLRRAKKNKSDSDLNDMRNPTILSYVQLVQKNCLMDKTPRQCPIAGCQKLSYGIINYNDHLNLCHFKNRTHICHYCHEGFETEHERIIHENQHIGINAFGGDFSGYRSATNSPKLANITETNPEQTIPNEKLKKIVSYFDKLNSSDNASEKSKESESNAPLTSESTSVDSDMKVVKCMSAKNNFQNPSSEVSTYLDLEKAKVSCQFCGETFKFRRQLSLHEQIKHNRIKFSKYNSCPGSIMRTRSKPTFSEDGRIVFQSRSNSCIHDDVPSEETLCKTDLSCDPSTNIVYFASLESVKKPSVVVSLVNKVKSYKWESGSKIIKI